MKKAMRSSNGQRFGRRGSTIRRQVRLAPLAQRLGRGSCFFFPALVLVCMVAAFAMPPVHAANPAPPDDDAPGNGIVLEPVIVTAPRVVSDAARVPAAVTIVNSTDITQGRPSVQLTEGLARVPGVFVQNDNNFAQDLRISIRGFGARSAFGIRGIQIHVDGIPLALPDGQSTFDTIDPNIISRLEVMRGPVSTLYGNAAGGVINIVTPSYSDRPSLEAGTTAGAHGLWKNSLQSGGQTGAATYFLALSHISLHGYRERSQAEIARFYGKLRYDIDDASDLTLLINGAHTPEAQDPGGLTKAQAQSDPKQAASLSRLYNTGETVSDGRIGLVYRREVIADQHLEVAGYINRRKLENAIPFRFIDLNRTVLGGRIQYDLSGTLRERSHRLVTGIDVQRQIDEPRKLHQYRRRTRG